MGSICQSLRRQQECGERHHYNLRTMLGKAHELKMAAWMAHQLVCEARSWSEEEQDERMDEILEASCRDTGFFVSWEESVKGRRKVRNKKKKKIQKDVILF